MIHYVAVPISDSAFYQITLVFVYLNSTHTVRHTHIASTAMLQHQKQKRCRPSAVMICGYSLTPLRNL